MARRSRGLRAEKGFSATSGRSPNAEKAEEPANSSAKPCARSSTSVCKKTCPPARTVRQSCSSMARDQPLLVALLPPRIREVHEHDVETRIGKTLDGLARILGEHASSRAKALLAKLLVDERRPLQANLQSDHAQARVDQDPLEQEAAATRPYLQLDWASLTLDELARIDVLPFGQSGRFGGIGMVLHGRG